MIDTYNRDIRYMRISITDRCNFQCTYCASGQAYVEHKEILRYEEIYQIVEAAVSLGITHFRVTGGEPFARRDCMEFLHNLVRINGVESVGITTNGSLLTEEMVCSLATMGISSVNISLDTLDSQCFEKITANDCCTKVRQVVDWCLMAQLPVKINAVWGYQRDIEDIRALVKLTKDNDIALRFIEEMAMGKHTQEKNNNQEQLRYLVELMQVPYKEVIYNGFGPARYIQFEGYQGCIGFIEPIHHKFCERCNRIRLTSMGELRMCLYHADYIDLKTIVRNHALTKEEKQTELTKAIAAGIKRKPKEHHFGDEPSTRAMHTIGG